MIPMPFFIDGQQYFEGINLTQEEFYEKLKNDADISTSQPSVGELQDEWDKLLKEYDEIVFIPMSSGRRLCFLTIMTVRFRLSTTSAFP